MLKRYQRRRRANGAGAATDWLVAVATAKLKIKAATAEEICAEFPLSDAARPHLKPAIAPIPFLEALIANALYGDAVQFLARALPKREAVWWACLCTRELLPVEGKPALTAGVEAAEAWVYRPTEDNRRKAEKAGEAITASHPARWAAMAAFWSDGSMAPPDAPEVKPAGDLAAKAVAGAVLMAASLDAAKAEARHKLFLDYGRDIANGGTGRPPAKR